MNQPRLNTLTHTHYYGPTFRLGLYFVRVNFGGRILSHSAVTDDFGRLVYIERDLLIIGDAA